MEAITRQQLYAELGSSESTVASGPAGKALRRGRVQGSNGNRYECKGLEPVLRNIDVFQEPPYEATCKCKASVQSGIGNYDGA